MKQPLKGIRPRDIYIYIRHKTRFLCEYNSQAIARNNECFSSPRAVPTPKCISTYLRVRVASKKIKSSMRERNDTEWYYLGD